MKKLIVLITLLCTSFYQTFAQNPPSFCGVDEEEAFLIKNDPTYLARKTANEATLQHYIATHPQTEREIITIPVVFHIVHRDVNIVNSITPAIIQSQIDVLNRDFSKQNYDINYLPPEFMARTVDTEIQFCLAKQTPSGAATTSIVRKSGTSAVRPC